MTRVFNLPIMLVLIALISISVTILSGCGQAPPEAVKNSKTDSTEHIHSLDSVPIGYLNFKLISDLTKKISSNQKWDSASIKECQDWKINRDSLKNIIREMDIIKSPEELHARCYFYPCTYEGIVSDGVNEYVINVAPSSQITIELEDTSIVYVFTKPNSMFLSVCDCCE